MLIRPATDADRDAIFDIVDPVFKAGETYAYPRDLSPSQTLDIWFAPGNRVFVAERDGTILGTYYLRPNFKGGRSGIGNCGYITASPAQGQGVARAMGLHSLDQARSGGFRAIAFNFVVSTNTRAVALWQSLGFRILATLPQAFDHPRFGQVDAYLMWQDL